MLTGSEPVSIFHIRLFEKLLLGFSVLFRSASQSKNGGEKTTQRSCEKGQKKSGFATPLIFISCF